MCFTFGTVSKHFQDEWRSLKSMTIAELNIIGLRFDGMIRQH